MISSKKSLFLYVRNKGVFKDCKIIGENSGHSNKNYFVESKGKKFVIRRNLEREETAPRVLKNEHHLLRFLEKKKIDFVPKSIFYDGENNIHILSYVEGRKIRMKNISLKLMEQAALKLHEINILGREYKNYCKTVKIKAPRTKSVFDSVRKKALEKMLLLGEMKGFKTYKSWIAERFFLDFYFYKNNKKNIFLNHGDPSDNLILSKDKIFIIDWEYVQFTYGPGLAHILKFGRLGYEKEKSLLRLYEKVSGISYTELYKKAYVEKMAFYLYEMLKIIEKCYKSGYLDKEKTKEDLKILKKHYLQVFDRVKRYI